jgi:phosphonate transport system substrate-binding protein
VLLTNFRRDKKRDNTQQCHIYEQSSRAMTTFLRLCGLFLCLPGALFAAEPLRFAAVALENKEVMISQFSPLLARISQHIGQPTKFVFHDHYDAILDAFSRRQVDLAYLGPLPYVRLREQNDQVELVVRFKEADGSGSYRCVIAAFRGDAIRLADLKNKTLGLTQTLSTCGPLSVNGLLRKHAGFGLNQTRQKMLGSHENVALSIIGGDVAAGGMKEAIAGKYVGLGLEVLARTDPLPGFALVANRATLTATEIARLRQFLLQTPAVEFQSWGESLRHGIQPALDHEYDVVRSLTTQERVGNSNSNSNSLNISACTDNRHTAELTNPCKEAPCCELVALQRISPAHP